MAADKEVKADDIEKLVEERVKELVESIGKGGVNKEIPEELKDYVELKMIFKAISEFIEGIRGPLKELLKTFIGEMSGSALGKDIADFYKELVESGVDEEVAAELTKEYFKKRTQIADLPSLLFKLLSSKGKPSTHVEEGREEEEEESE